MKEARYAGHVRGAGMFPGILGSFWDMVCKLNLGQVMATEGKQPNFQAFFDNFWALCAGHVLDASWMRPCSGCVMATVGIEPDFQAILAISGTRCAGNVRDASGPWKGCSLVSRQFLGHGVQAIFGMRRAAAGMQPDFSTLLGNFWDTMCKPQLRRIWATSGMQLDFQAFVESFWARCAGHVRDASWPQ
ncbi:Hypothetical predicted protein [Olea europaea subsp. europaea]|uniref:Uncharacterized protein n=1 Tax=Olea europaea subsp. europaea TaxID=158383 RepID=A0A8S0PNG0_OLEEU|nr:Hypothetical predicted protein [Olea europaea subsp. europaea]